MGMYKDTTTNLPEEERIIVGADMNGHMSITEDGYTYIRGGHGYGETNWSV